MKARKLNKEEEGGEEEVKHGVNTQVRNQGELERHRISSLSLPGSFTAYCCP